MQRLILKIGVLNATIVLTFTGAPTQARCDVPYVVGVMGDSVSAGFNAYRYGDNREFSWAGGLVSEQAGQGPVQSHAQKLQTIMPDRTVVVRNEAFVGADSANLARQTARLLRVTPDYVTIAMGANDVCVWGDDYVSSLNAYEASLVASIEAVIAKNHHVKIVLAPVPALRLMYEMGLRRQGCQQTWDVIGVCRPLLATDLSDDARERFYARHRHLNQVIESVAMRYPRHVRFARALADAVFDETSISPLDCFHPSLAGQNLISDYSFDPTWY
jgi:lysophospholipase L1-like esterase